MVAAALLLASCGGTPSAPPAGRGAPDATVSGDGPEPAGSAAAGGGDGARAGQQDLRPGERFDRLAMPAAYTPSAPYGTGTDDYRCFLLDPRLDRDAFLTGTDVLPGSPDQVHHVILFRVPPGSVAAAEARDAGEDGPGWTCFGGSGLDDGASLDDAPWIGAWAPGSGESVMADDVGIPLQEGSRVVMQVHYNLLAGTRPDVSAVRLRLAPSEAGLARLQTVLLPAPVELPCRPGHGSSPLCDRDKAVRDVTRRFGQAGRLADYLHLLCGSAAPGPRQSCDRELSRPATIRAVAGHMHLLGRRITIEVDPGTPRARTVLDIPVWNFDDQGATTIDPVRLRAGDTVRVTCEHDQGLRDLLPAFEGQPERWVVWGEGTTDEMCLGLLMVTRP
ncbi:hypothetical protein H9L09_02405 [Nocardioides mesophilus]|uniref:Copper type II ascorbate-dependent monooxygenase C-terminal domain-containing protein n=1 Tax=Nocardioides mesophilus TaxID=433659 RepID=A0A7G9RGQ7_9ACTN|nr:hypothetical protein H9L09_02405 [Nocardioides mesophilus]